MRLGCTSCESPKADTLDRDHIDPLLCPQFATTPRSVMRSTPRVPAAVAPHGQWSHLAEILDELGISQYRLAKAIGTPARRINEVVRGRRSITADTALRIGLALGMTPESWLNLQALYDLDVARASANLDAIKPLVAAG